MYITDRLLRESDLHKHYKDEGILILNKLIDPNIAIALGEKFEKLFSGEFETGVFPDEWTWRPNLGKPEVTREMVNIWKCDRQFASLILSEALGYFIATINGWSGSRIAQDDMWWKPTVSGSSAPSNVGSILYHRDATYFTSFQPCQVSTLWIALDDTTSGDTGTLELIPRSHLWSTNDQQIPKDFFSPENPKKLLEQSNYKDDIVPVLVKPGGASVHDGLIYHGSGSNTNPHIPRRSLAIHFMPEDCTFSDNVNYIYGRYKKWGSKELDEDFFPITYSSKRKPTHWISQYCQNFNNFNIE